MAYISTWGCIPLSKWFLPQLYIDIWNIPYSVWDYKLFMGYKPLTKWVAIHPYCLTISPAGRRSWLCHTQVGMGETSPSKAVVVSCGLRVETGALLTAVWDWKCMARKWEIMFSCLRCLFFLKLSFSYKLSNVYQVFLELFGRMPYSLPKIGQALQRPMQEIYTGITSTERRLSRNLIFLHISRLSHTVGICLTQCCAGIVTAVEILYLNMKPLDHHSPGFSIWSSDIFWSCAKLHPVPVPRSYQASDCSAFVTHFSFSVVGAIRTLLAGDGNHVLSPPKRFRWVKTISIPATNHAVCWGTHWLPTLSSYWWRSISSIPSCPSWSPVEDSNALQPVLHSSYLYSI